MFVCESWSLPLRKEHKLRVFENRVLREIFGPKKDKATGKWRRLHNDELYDLHSLLNIIRMIKRRMRWVGHVANAGDSKGSYSNLVGKLEGRSNLEDLDVDGRIILKRILK